MYSLVTQLLEQGLSRDDDLDVGRQGIAQAQVSELAQLLFKVTLTGTTCTILPSSAPNCRRQTLYTDCCDRKGKDRHWPCSTPPSRLGMDFFITLTFYFFVHVLPTAGLIGLGVAY